MSTTRVYFRVDHELYRETTTEVDGRVTGTSVTLVQANDPDFAHAARTAERV